jgi:mannosyltransferase OCH1-like enzyme
MIPKKIHYVWLSGEPLTPLVEKCIESWKKFCPDYEIIKWDTGNFDVNSNLYCRQAFENKKWAFASDYIRLKVVYEHGGIYLDSDVELLKPLDDFLNKPAFTGFECNQYFTANFFGAEKHSLWLKHILSHYEQAEFININEKFDLTPAPMTVARMTKQIIPELKTNNTEQHYEFLSIYPTDYFSPIDVDTKKMKITKNTHAIHHFAGAWLNRSLLTKTKYRIKRIIKKILGKKRLDKWRERKEKKRAADFQKKY